MAGVIVRVEHRHGDQKSRDPNLVLEVGKPLPSFYQAGRPKGVLVKSFAGDDPVKCVLADGDIIFIGKNSVVGVTRAVSDA